MNKLRELWDILTINDFFTINPEIATAILIIIAMILIIVPMLESDNNYNYDEHIESCMREYKDYDYCRQQIDLKIYVK